MLLLAPWRDPKAHFLLSLGSFGPALGSLGVVLVLLGELWGAFGCVLRDERAGGQGPMGALLEFIKLLLCRNIYAAPENTCGPLVALRQVLSLVLLLFLCARRLRRKQNRELTPGWTGTQRMFPFCGNGSKEHRGRKQKHKQTETQEGSESGTHSTAPRGDKTPDKAWGLVSITPRVGIPCFAQF